MRFFSLFVLLFWYQDLLACAVCSDKADASAGIYLASTIMLSLVPLIALGGVGYYLYRNMKRAKAKE